MSLVVDWHNAVLPSLRNPSLQIQEESKNMGFLATTSHAPMIMAQPLPAIMTMNMGDDYDPIEIDDYIEEEEDYWAKHGFDWIVSPIIARQWHKTKEKALPIQRMWVTLQSNKNMFNNCGRIWLLATTQKNAKTGKCPSDFTVTCVGPRKKVMQQWVICFLQSQCRKVTPTR